MSFRASTVAGSGGLGVLDAGYEYSFKAGEKYLTTCGAVAGTPPPRALSMDG